MFEYSAPLPPPGFVEKYEQVLPGSFNRILNLTEQQSTHRQRLESAALFSDQRNSRLGVILGFVLSMVIVLIGACLIYLGKNATGLFLIVGDIAALAGVFIYGTSSRKRERQKKYQASQIRRTQ